MGKFKSLADAEARVKTKVSDGTWQPGAHAANGMHGEPFIRFKRYMSAKHPDSGGWEETDLDDVD